MHIYQKKHTTFIYKWKKKKTNYGLTNDHLDIKVYSEYPKHIIYIDIVFKLQKPFKWLRPTTHQTPPLKSR